METDFIKFNNHPKGLITSDCVVRSVSKALDKDYLETRKELNNFKRQIEHDSYKTFMFLHKYFKNYELIMFNNYDGGEKPIKIKDFKQNYPEGTYVLRTPYHLTTYIDGTIYDTWDCREKEILSAWRIK